MNYTYSFVIPHHNTPDLLQRLIDSIPQRDDIEIIVVDDNSDEDKKANITRSDVKTFFIDKEHTKGAGHARNVGMATAKGKWLLFADADDFYTPHFIEILDEHKDDDIEMLFYNINSVDSDTLLPNNRSQLQRQLISQYDGSQKASDLLLWITFSPWRRMLLTSYVKKYGFRFEETLRGNDMFFSLQVSYFAKKWAVDKRNVYNLTHYNGSLTFGKETRTKYKTLLLIYRRTAEFYEFIGHPEWNRKSIKGRYPQSCLKQVLRFYRINRWVGIKALFYYLSHYIYINNNAKYYVDVIKAIQQKVDNT